MTTSRPTSSPAPRTTAATPESLPRYVVLAVDPPPPALHDQTLLSLDRRTGTTNRIVDAASPPPGVTGPWELAGFDVSPDDRSVAFGASWGSSAGSGGPDVTGAGIFLAPIDGRAPPRRLTLITGSQPSVWVERFSPDGRWLLAARATWTAFPVDGAGPIVSNVLSPYLAAGAEWSSDGTSVAVGDHYEAPIDSELPTTEVLRFDAAHRTLTRAAAQSGTDPWYDANGRLHVVTKDACSLPADVDSSFRWGLSTADSVNGCPGTSELTWWSTATGPSSPHSLPVTLPQGLIHGAAW